MGTLDSINVKLKPQKQYPPWIVRLDQFARRTLDLLVAIFGLIFFVPLFLFVAVLIRCDSKGPVFYRGPRLGQDDALFNILKFRTMDETGDSYNGPPLTASQDPRITRVGRWLRNTKINELPQLWNVLVGEMSLVGPRPESPLIKIDWPHALQAELSSIRPGITSPASIMFIDEESQLSDQNLIDDYLEKILPVKLHLDLIYIRRRTILNDLDIIFLTLIAFLPKLRNKAATREVLLSGPLYNFFSRFLNWFLIDWLVAVVTITLAGGLWRISAPLNIGLPASILVALIMATVFSLTNLLFGLNRIAWRYTRADKVIDLAISSGLAFLVIYILNLLHVFPFRLNTSFLMFIGAATFMGFVTARYRERLVTGLASRWLSLRHQNQGTSSEKVLIIGAGETGIKTSWFFNHGYLSKVYSIVGFLDDDLSKSRMIIDGYPVLGMTTDLAAMIDTYAVDTVVMAISCFDPGECAKLSRICDRMGVQYLEFESIMDLLKTLTFSETVEVSEITGNRVPVHFLSEIDDLLESGDVSRAREKIKHIQQLTRQVQD